MKYYKIDTLLAGYQKTSQSHRTLIGAFIKQLKI
jgi:hypothetical protein